MFKQNVLLLLSVVAVAPLFAQPASDTLRDQVLREISVKTQRETILRLPAIQGAYLWAGKKSEVISLSNMDVNIAEKTPRQVFAKVPGVFVYDMDGTGNQTNISTRSLDPHRGWEFNIRTNGLMTNSDLYGYPASHFSLPFEAVERIELVRGTGALQYGAQFGGMLNYVVKQADTTRAFGAESINSAGSFGLLSTYNAVGGKVGKWQYYAFYSRRGSDGYRDNSASDYDGQGLVLTYTPSGTLTLKAEVFRSNYLYRIPGPLTDAQFADNPRQATRTRNYFNPELVLPALSAEWQIGPGTRLSWTASGLLGERRSVQFDRPATVRDTISHSTFAYSERQVDIDRFQSFTTELRLLQEYALFGETSVLSAGIQYIHNDMNRRQQGKGTTGSDYDLTISAAGWGRDLLFKTRNTAVFLENKFQVTPQLFFSPGVRVELGSSDMTGNVSYLPPIDVATTIKRSFPLFGVNAGYTLNAWQSLYAGWSQAYRPVLFKDIIPGNFYERTDPDMKDASGYNLELGWRGTAGGFKWDVSAFSLRYNNRPGSLTMYSNLLDTVILFRTNIGDARTHGLELFAEYGFRFSEHWYAGIFTSTSYMDARYLGDSLRVSSAENRSIKGNRLESAPQWISRNGLNIKYKTLSASLLYSYTAESYADPLNTRTPNATGAVGIVPAYGLLDLNASCRLLHNLTLRLSVNNLTDQQYFTKRPVIYPGPGVWPSDGRSVVVTVQVGI
jgi:Fe(3+) dicitrate transport protein